MFSSNGEKAVAPASARGAGRPIMRMPRIERQLDEGGAHGQVGEHVDRQEAATAILVTSGGGDTERHAGRSGASLPFVPAVQRPATAQETLDLFLISNKCPPSTNSSCISLL